MKSKLLSIALFGLTAASVVYYPQLMAKTVPVEPPVARHVVKHVRPTVDVVFVLDTTGSMGGLIQTAKDKIWSIATTMASAESAPDIRIGLVAYRDRSDQYETRVIDLSDDLDSVYASLMDFEANGGGDTPESVNRALYDAVHNMSWSQSSQAYQVIFLVGDAPPHMDYDEVRYPATLAAARQKGIVVNTIQCGEIPMTAEPWTRIANLGQGSFFQVEQAGGAVAYTTPYDRKIAELSEKLDDTRLYFGNREEKAQMQKKINATDKLHEGASLASRARRGVFNTSASGRANQLGKNELVEAIASGELTLSELDEDALPEAMKPMAPAEQEAYVAELASDRSDLNRQLKELADEREQYLAKKVEEAGGLRDSLDQKLFEAVRDQARDAGLEYRDGPAY